MAQLKKKANGSKRSLSVKYLPVRTKQFKTTGDTALCPTGIGQAYIIMWARFGSRVVVRCMEQSMWNCQSMHILSDGALHCRDE